MGVPFWEDDPGAYDVIDIAGWLFYVRPDTSGECGIKIDVKTAPGVDGTTIKYQGVEPAKVTLALMLWKAEHLRDFEGLVATIRPRQAKKAPAPVEIVHPLLELYGLRRFYIEKPSLPKRASGGYYEVALSCIEWFAAPKAAKKAPAGGASAASVSAVYVPPAGTSGGPPLPPSVFGPPPPPLFGPPPPP